MAFMDPHYSYDPLTMPSEEMEKMRRMTTAWSQARVIINELWDNHYPFAIDLDNGIPTLQTIRRQKQLMTKLFSLLAPGRLLKENREVVLEHYAKLVEYFNSLVLPEGWNEYLNKLQEQYRRNSQPVYPFYDADDSDSESEDEVPFYHEGETDFMKEYEDPVNVVESSDEEMSPEEYRPVGPPHISSDSDSD